MAQPAQTTPLASAVRRPAAANLNRPGGVPVLTSIGRFGVVTVDPRKMVRPATNIGMVAQDFRERIRDFVDGERRTNRLSDFMNYLREKTLGLETRRDHAGRDTNYIVDLKSRDAVAASIVDPRLSVGGIKRMFGLTPTEVADRKADVMSPEQKRAMEARRMAAPYLLGRNGAPPFENWEDMRFCSARVFGGELTARGSDLWVGKQVGVSSEDPAANLRMLKEFAARGVKVIAPARTVEDLKAGRLVHGMPILDAATSTRTALVSKTVSMQSLDATFGSSLFQHHEKMNSEFARNRPTASVVNAEEFLLHYTRRTRRPTPGVPIQSGTTLRQDVGEDGMERMRVVHSDRTVSSFDFRRLPAGRYRKEDEFGMPCGLIDVSATGYTHLDAAGRPHNETGPASVRYTGVEKTEAYALDGVTIDKANLYTPRTPAPAPERTRTPSTTSHAMSI